jgi:hypothetical protein
MRDSLGAVLNAQVIARATEHWNDLSFFMPAFLLSMEIHMEHP